AAELEAVRARKHEVEDDEVGPVRLDELVRVSSVGGLQGPEAVASQVLDDDLANRRLVVDDEDGAHVESLPAFALSGSELPRQADEAAAHLDEAVGGQCV